MSFLRRVFGPRGYPPRRHRSARPPGSGSLGRAVLNLVVTAWILAFVILFIGFFTKGL